MDMSKYKSMFISETQEHLQSMNQGLLKLEQDPRDPEAIAELFRNAHSIKGMAASMGYELIRDLAHAMEDLMDDFREGSRAPEAKSMDLLFKGLDILEAQLQDVNLDRELSPASIAHAREIRSFRGEPVELSPPAPAPPPPAPTPPARPAGPAAAAPVRSWTLEPDGPVKVAPPTTAATAPAKEKLKRSSSAKRPAINLEEVEFDFELSAAPAAKPALKTRPEPEVWPPRPDQDEKEFEETAPADPVLAAFTLAPTPSPNGAPSKSAPAAAPVEIARPPSPPMQADEPILEDAPVPADELNLETPIEIAAPALAPPPIASVSNLTLRVVFARDTASPAVRGLILFKRLGEVGEIVASRPPAAEVKSGSFLPDPKGLAVELELSAEAGIDAVRKVMASMADVESFEVKAAEAAPVSPPAPPAPAELEAAPSAEPSPRTEPAYDPFAQAQALPQTVRVKTTALDQFINSLGEMIQVKSELREVAKRNPLEPLVKGIDRLESLIRDFSDQVMTVRMMPIDSVVQRLPRVVRDLARDEGKKVRFEVLGKDIELDRAILENLSDPLIHLLRNAVSHGIETPEERRRLGKPEEGHVVVEAYRARDLVAIDVRDDGRGIDPFHLRETAVQKGLVGQEEADHMSDEAAFQLIFMPGFSTAKAVGMVSGRGVGMDAVKTVIEGIGGAVSLASQIGKGVTFSLHLPQSIAIVHVLLIRMANEIFAIPIAKVLKTVEILPHQIRLTQGKRYYVDRQELIPIKALHRFLDLPEPKPKGREPLQALIVEVRKRKNALLVDDLFGQEEAFIRPLGKPLERISGLSGVTMLGDGRLVFVLDTMSLL